MSVTRRDWIKASAALAASLPHATARSGLFQSVLATDDPLAAVDPLIGTGAHGHCTPAACVPHGMVQLGPDTDLGRWDVCSGYHYDDPTILGFSHSHLSGTGAADLLDLLVVPRIGDVELDPGDPHIPGSGYRQRFDHDAERATPGWYAVRLSDSAIEAELTVTRRCGWHRYRFPAAGHLLIDWSHAVPDGQGVARLSEASLTRVGADLITGSRHVHGWADGRQVHFALRVHAPIAEVRFFSDDRPSPAGTSAIAGARLKCAIMLADAAAGPVVVHAALSAVDVAGAVANLDSADEPGDFDRARRAAGAQWAAELARVRVAGGTADQRQIMASAHYHTRLAPTLFADSDGRYRAMDSAVRVLAQGETNYTTYSLWDTFRCVHPLLSLIDPQANAAFARNLAMMTLQSPFGAPVWPLQGVETRCMPGAHGLVVIAEALAKGVSGIDARAVWARVRQRAFDEPQDGLAAYRRLGWVPADQMRESVSRTIDFAIDDAAMAVIAAAAGAAHDAALLEARARSWRNLYDPMTGFVRPRLADGFWAEPFDPVAMGHPAARWPDYAECNGWQATFLAQHDPWGMVEVMGGDARFEARLDALFAADPRLAADAPPDIAGMDGQYAQGNEPSHHVAWLYAWCGSPWKTQFHVRRLLDTMYKTGPEGLPGNEDCGQMSAWFVLAALGLYPVDPASGVWVLGSPLFPRAELQVAGGTLVIETRGGGADAIYVQQVLWNGRHWPRSWIAHARLARGGHLVFEMGTEPNRVFGRAPEARPPRPLIRPVS